MRPGRGKITATILAALSLVCIAGAATWLAMAHYLRFGPFADPGPARDASIAGLPLVVVPALNLTQNTNLMAILYTGDGGWTPINQCLTAELARHGVPTVGIISPRYFWTRRTPDAAARDLERIIDLYSVKWRRPRVILVGYSRGAGVLPAMVNRLDEARLTRIEELALLGLEPRIAFAVGVRDYLSGLFDTDECDVLPELKRVKVPIMICIYGEQEKKSLICSLDLPAVKKIALPGGHHFGGAYERLARLILTPLSASARLPASPPSPEPAPGW